MEAEDIANHYAAVAKHYQVGWGLLLHSYSWLLYNYQYLLKAVS